MPFLPPNQQRQSMLKANAATLPYNFSLIACFLTLIFHNVVWQQLLDVVGFLIIILLQIH